MTNKTLEDRVIDAKEWPDLCYTETERELIAKLKVASSLVQDLHARIKELERELGELDHKLSCVLKHATGGALSYPAYTIEVMYDGINGHLNNERQESFDEGKEAGYQNALSELESQEITEAEIEVAERVMKEIFRSDPSIYPVPDCKIAAKDALEAARKARIER